ncbi:MAG: hypothetical protein H6713_33915, partial [Myxococcales bacterium]|nr:hypothetical protein [Myxococcales bacterium]
MRDWITSLYRSLSLLFAAASTTLGLTLTCAGTLALLVALLVTPRPVLAAPASEPARALPGVPAELAPWIEWVRELELPAGDCREVEDATICVWPGRLALQAGEQGASFELDVTAFNRELVTLPGDDAAWPQDVRVDGKPAVVRDGAEEAAGAPTVELAVGRHRVSGRFIWPERPDTLAVPDEIALVELELAGQRVAIPERVDGLLTLALPGAPPRAEEPEEPATQEPAVDSERLEVSRWLRDGVPLTITTRLDLHVSGKPRAITLPYPLWDDVELLRIDSSLPLRLGEERALVVQARAGSHTITLEAALPRAPEQLGPPELPAPWPAEEVWVWRAAGAGEAALGQVAVTGGLAVDRSRTHAPEAWDGGATFQVRATSPLAFEVLQRGVSETAPNELSLRREMRPIMAGAGWTVRDEIEGALHQSTRLDLQAGALGSAIVNDRPQVVTEGPGGATGVELREPSIRLLGTWRSEQLTRTLPLGGWSETFDRVTLEFWLPRGWDVLRIDGPGKGSRTWLESWRALDLLALLGVCVLLGRLLSPWVGGVALLGLGLAYTSRGDGYLMLLALVALLAGLPTLTARARESAWLRRGLWLGWGLCAALLTIWILWGVPQQVHGVWLERESALDAYGLERELTEVLGVALTLWLALGVITGVAWFIGHARVPGRVVVIPAVALAGFAALLLFVQADAPMTDARPTAAYWEAGAASNKDEEPPPEELENLSDDEAGG